MALQRENGEKVFRPGTREIKMLGPESREGLERTGTDEVDKDQSVRLQSFEPMKTGNQDVYGVLPAPSRTVPPKAAKSQVQRLFPVLQKQQSGNLQRSDSITLLSYAAMEPA